MVYGKNTDFWEDKWCGNFSLREKFTNLFDVCNEQRVTVADMANRNWQFSFRRWLTEGLQGELRGLRDLLFIHRLTNEKDKQKWAWEKSGKFSLKSLYDHLFMSEPRFPNKMLWKAKIPLKIKIFLWLAAQDAILTKDNLVKRKWKGNKKCAFCEEEESITHIFFPV